MVKREGICALAFFPLMARGQLVGKFMAYYSAPHAFQQHELALAVTISRQLGVCLERIAAENERQEAERAKELLLEESKHRIKNTLAMVQAIAVQSLKRDMPDALNAFYSRLHALSEANDVLTTENWHRARLQQVVDRALKPFDAGMPSRFDIDGNALWLPARTAMLLTMCLHELATNAAKYGALSNGDGRVRIAWTHDGDSKPDAVVLVWKESGGPPVVAPTRKGFGSRLVQSSSDDSSGIAFEPDGVRCQLRLQL